MTFETLHETITSMNRQMLGSKIVLTKDGEESLSNCYGFGGIRYDEVKRCNVEIETLKGKKTKRWWHVVVTRFNNGRYELVCYSL